MASIALNKLLKNEVGRVIHVNANDLLQHRLAPLGVVPGLTIKMIRTAPLGDPVEYELLGCHLCLRQEDAQLIDVELLRD
ncbi:MAG: ferrous iron transport protein A [Endozoicomonadaceae bacterium]|nr:ferrous iron transport protein A [Endozoicomonadaceae bacterium]